MKTKQELKLYFENGDIPKQEDFWAWQDSYWHKDEKISQDSIDSIEQIIPFFLGNDLLGSGIDLKIPTKTKKILSSAFAFDGGSHQIIKVTFNEGLEEIGETSFIGQNITSIITPSTLKTIKGQAFYDQKNSFRGTGSLEKIILNEGLITIEFNAFYCPTSIVEDLYIPSTVKTIGKNALYLPSLKIVSAPKGLDLSEAGIPTTASITYR
ncbi:leucine-rich repeat domain-containing protein [Chryseobacterium sp. c4a]|uniref:leucine-rich repeat domain-containing protein n=1 Tax=Chryseobacterium sp. c4a TaxID=1573582 RepID=UPI00135B2F2C|nr:leucine-rich repeat domain-containing protein [Chryseobacterium sp. c4a]